MKKWVYYFLVTLSFILFIATILSLIEGSSYWWIKSLDFPRLQIALISFILWIVFLFSKVKWKYPILIGLSVVLIIQIRLIFPYTTLAEEVVPNSVTSEDDIKVLIANVYMKNKEEGKLKQLIQTQDADILLLMETNQRWMNAVQPEIASYPHKIEIPLDNTYGMLFYSKFDIESYKIHYLDNPDVPTIEMVLNLGNKKIKVFAVHPVPPFPSKHPDNIGEKETALIQVGIIAKQSEYPVLVIGDFNDVAWSKQNHLFSQNGFLNNVAYGRGIINTYNAKKFYMRWPLDHIYVTEHFGISRLKLLSDIGSDHFPLYAELSLGNN